MPQEQQRDRAAYRQERLVEVRLDLQPQGQHIQQGWVPEPVQLTLAGFEPVIASATQDPEPEVIPICDEPVQLVLFR